VKKGICDVCIDEGTTFDEKLAAARRAGYDGVELSIGVSAPAPVHLGMDRAVVEGVRETVARHGLEVSSLMGGVLRDSPVLSPDPAVRRQAVANFAGALERAQWLGLSTVLMHPGQLKPEQRYDEAWAGTVEALRALIPACERTGVGIGLENVWNKFLLAPTEMRQILAEVNHPLVGCYLDTANMLLYGYAEHWVAIVGKKIRKVHVKDFKRGSGFCQLLAGDCNYPAVIRELRAIGYDDFLTSEVSKGERGPNETMADTAKRIDTIMAM
jgi:L-ribulose-5-phosphate 3-epimerase